MKHLTSNPDVSKLPQPFAAVILRAMMKDPENRYRDVGEMLAALGWNGSSAWNAGQAAAAPSGASLGDPSLALRVGMPEAAPVVEIRDEPPAKGEPLYIGYDSPGAEGIEFGQVREQPPIIGGIKVSGTPAAPQPAPARPAQPPQRRVAPPRPGPGRNPGAAAVAVAAPGGAVASTGMREPVAASSGYWAGWGAAALARR
jgi:hypothetical protein